MADKFTIKRITIEDEQRFSNAVENRGKEYSIKLEMQDEKGRDRHIAFVYVDGICVNKELLKLGLAWHYKRYDSSPELAQLEASARKEGKGLWSQQNPVAPWDYRKK